MLTWNGLAGYNPNEYGGETAMYNFCLHGSEAVSFTWVDAFVAAVKDCGGEVKNVYCRDMEGCC